MSEWAIRELGLEDVPAFRPVRLEALRLHPQAFGSSYEEEAAYTLDDFAARWPVPPGVLLGAHVADRLIGFAGLLVSPKVKQRHKGLIVMVYVDAAYRGQSVAEALLRGVIAHARQAGLRFVTLTVATSNEPARRLYRRLGFRIFGTEARSLLVDGVLVDEDMMVLDLD